MSTGLRKVKTYKESKPVTKVGRTIKGGGGRKSCQQLNAQILELKTFFLLQRCMAFIRDGEVSKHMLCRILNATKRV